MAPFLLSMSWVSCILLLNLTIVKYIYSSLSTTKIPKITNEKIADLVLFMSWDYRN